MIEGAVQSLYNANGHCMQIINESFMDYHINHFLADIEKDVDIGNKKRAKKKKSSKQQMNDSQQTEEKAHEQKKRIAINSLSTLPCILCPDNRYILASNVLWHNSYHFITQNKNTKEYEISIPVPTHQYNFSDNGTMTMVKIPQNEQKELDQCTCCICLSGNCQSSHDKKKKWTESDCPLFARVGIKTARKVTPSNPTTNIMEKCTKCECYVYKYLMPKHFKMTHPSDVFPESLKVTATEMNKVYTLFETTQNRKEKKPKHGVWFNLLVPYKGKPNTYNKTKQKASNKYSLKHNTKHKDEPKKKRRRLNKNNQS